MTCMVKGCGNYIKKTKKTEGSTIKYFTFPKQSEIAEQWRKACGKDSVNVQSGRICSKHFDDACFVKPLQQQMLNYSPARAKKLRSDAIPTLYLPLTTIASVPEEVLGSSYDINASTTAEAFHTAVPLPVSVADICYQEVSPQMFSDASLAAETFPSPGVVPLPVSGDASLDTDVVHRALPSNVQDILLENAALTKKLYNLEQRIEIEDQRFDRRMHDLLKTIFTPGQIRLLLNPELSKTKWSNEDIANAISLRCASPKGYCYVKNVMKIPLPGMSTLRRYTSSLKVDKKSFS